MDSLYDPVLSLVEYKSARFLITNMPHMENMEKFVQAYQQCNVTDLVCVCEQEYDSAMLEQHNISVINWNFEDGSSPPDEIIQSWHYLVKKRFSSRIKEADVPDNPCVAVHCKAGLGRAPTLVAISLIELGVPFQEAIEMIRSKKPGALNQRQIQFLKNYRPRKRLHLQGAVNRLCSLL